MGHDHDHNHDAVGNIKIAFFLNLSFTIIEIVGGILTNSVAIMSDAVHDLGDSISLGLAWYFQKLSRKGRDANYSYGYRRFSLLGAMINSLILFGGSVIIVREAIPRIIEPQETDAQGMILFAFVGIFANGLAAYKMMRGKSMNERVVYLHLLEDVLGWVAVLIGAIIIYFFDFHIIDPILSILIGCYIIYGVIKNLKKTMNILLQAVPDDLDMDKIKAYLGNHKYIKDYHDLHVWSMDGTFNVFTVHIELSENIDSSINPKNVIKKELLELGIDHPTIEFHEQDDEDLDNH